MSGGITPIFIPRLKLYGLTPPIHIPYFPKDSMVEVVDNYLTPREEMPRTMRDNLQSAEHRIVRMANKKRSERIFEIGDLVYLKLQPYQQKTIAHIISQKLASKVHTWFWRE